MKKIKLKVNFKKILADTFTPVSIYLKLRDKFPNSILLESSDYHGTENSFSFICFKPISTFKVESDVIIIQYPDGTLTKTGLEKKLTGHLNDFIKTFEIEPLIELKAFSGGLFGYLNYNSVKYFEDVELKQETREDKVIPDIFYSLYQYVIAINHFNNDLYIIETVPSTTTESSIENIESIINNKSFASYSFSSQGEEESNFTDKEFLAVVERAKEHCKRGDVFQLVLSREFTQRFSGDEFNVYRALRSINPSPYLFFFDYGNFKIFGSSPEAQIKIKNKKATIHPIAGTFKRTGDDTSDALLAEKLKADPKENAEHVMLVDLARNDLSKRCKDVKVKRYREIQYYSHVIHLVSEVTGTLADGSDLDIVAETFPAGTLSGAPKHMALKLIDKYEKGGRGFYGGCIGFAGFNGDFNHAIMIRSFLSKAGSLIYQAGAGIVATSQNESELNEVNNKLMALKRAIASASEIK